LQVDYWRCPGLEERVLEEVILASHAVKRLVEPAEVAGVVAFLLGPEGRAFTGDRNGSRLDRSLKLRERSAPGAT
jgi:NAD(P)-dependent dehydrogenase (short-subunit alcohol dehydrogenase family)